MEIFWNLQDLAARYGCSKATIMRDVKKGKLPRPIRRGGLRWPKAAIEQWERQAFADAQQEQEQLSQGQTV